MAQVDGIKRAAEDADMHPDLPAFLFERADWQSDPNRKELALCWIVQVDGSFAQEASSLLGWHGIDVKARTPLKAGDAR
jgi:hypothetical protein